MPFRKYVSTPASSGVQHSSGTPVPPPGAHRVGGGIVTCHPQGAFRGQRPARQHLRCAEEDALDGIPALDQNREAQVDGIGVGQLQGQRSLRPGREGELPVEGAGRGPAPRTRREDQPVPAPRRARREDPARDGLALAFRPCQAPLAGEACANPGESMRSARVVSPSPMGSRLAWSERRAMRSTRLLSRAALLAAAEAVGSDQHDVRRTRVAVGGTAGEGGPRELREGGTGVHAAYPDRLLAVVVGGLLRSVRRKRAVRSRSRWPCRPRPR